MGGGGGGGCIEGLLKVCVLNFILFLVGFCCVSFLLLFFVLFLH